MQLKELKESQRIPRELLVLSLSWSPEVFLIIGKECLSHVNLAARVGAGRQEVKASSFHGLLCVLPPKGVAQISGGPSSLNDLVKKTLQHMCPAAWVLITDVVKLVARSSPHGLLKCLTGRVWLTT